MDLFQGLYGLPEGKLQVDTVGKAQPHDVGIVFLILERGSPLGELVQIHIKEVDGELPVKVMEFILPVFRLWQVFGKFFKIPFVVGTVIIDTFMDTEMFPVFDRLEGMAADLAFKLSAAASIIVDILMWCTAERAYGIRRDITGLVFVWFDRIYSLAIAETVVLIPELPVLLDEWLDNGQLIGKEFLVLGTVEFIMSPLLERDVSADKENKPADLFVLFLNDSE